MDRSTRSLVAGQARTELVDGAVVQERTNGGVASRTLLPLAQVSGLLRTDERNDYVLGLAVSMWLLGAGMGLYLSVQGATAAQWWIMAGLITIGLVSLGVWWFTRKTVLEVHTATDAVRVAVAGTNTDLDAFAEEIEHALKDADAKASPRPRPL